MQTTAPYGILVSTKERNRVHPARLHTMKKTTYAIDFGYHFDANRSGAKYSFDGAHWMNAGDFKETALKLVRGLGASKDANTPYNVDSDIPQTHTSVKSSKATLVNKVLGESFEEAEAYYFETVASTNWSWVSVVDETLVEFNMNAEEFREFMETWAGWDKSRKVIRFKAESLKMLSWLEARA